VPAQDGVFVTVELRSLARRRLAPDLALAVRPENPQTQVDDVLFEHDDLLFQLVDVVGSTEPGFASSLLAKDFRQPSFELLNAAGDAGVSPQTGWPRCPADSAGVGPKGIRHAGPPAVKLLPRGQSIRS
jgi:hypothetical protein